jgi:hypothetical protein
MILLRVLEDTVIEDDGTMHRVDCEHASGGKSVSAGRLTWRDPPPKPCPSCLPRYELDIEQNDLLPVEGEDELAEAEDF